MKKIICLLILCFNFLCGQSQIYVTKTKTSSNNNGDNLHKIANEFSKEVGNKLKELYPAKINNISVKLKVVNGMLSLTYIAQIIKCNKQEAQYYFDHRGALSASNKKLNALNNAKSRVEQQKTEVVFEFKKFYNNVTVVSQNIDQIEYSGMFWVINELFIASSK